MCTLTHFAQPQPSCKSGLKPRHPAVFQPHGFPAPDLVAPRFQVVLAGNAFFHIKEISTGHVRGFRGDHNEACALARSLESRS
ncbi:hypothetical protein PS838_04664 [Pseudomonas fluorescens]|jgi:hypothetical protein|uniref:hypothetical protein n=1 Tax=Pseudomonas silesiensis TaxID=1853130 RepID=UPI0009EF4C9B|nr:hypothetical protein [Pseudomonas silesiensis]VVO61553.1 hypothetical protein PS850_00836 [Pseudomonas fluorescens]VVP37470.1 hypothetical protein PS838_04664 [Pseudomonas fluorescens]